MTTRESFGPPTFDPKVLGLFPGGANRKSELDFVAKERDEIESIFGRQNLIEFASPTSEQLLTACREYRNNICIFHFAGHTDRGKLLLGIDEDGDQLSLGNNFAKYLYGHPNLHLAFLNACATSEITDKVIDAGVNAVVSTNREIDDSAAFIFATSFYKELLSGESILRSFERAQIATLENEKISGNIKLTYRASYRDHVQEGHFPWDLFGSKQNLEWSWAEVVDDPHFGLPPLPSELKTNPIDSPFVGYNRFERKHARVFFGRAELTKSAYSKLNCRSNRVIMCHGEAGAGKSSFIQAGILPRLEDDNSLQVHSVVRQQSERLEKLLESSIGNFDDAHARWLLTLDQVEGAFTEALEKNIPQEVSEFAVKLDQLLKRFPKLFVLICFRREWLAPLKSSLKTAGVELSGGAEIYVGPLTERNIQQSVLLSPKIRAEQAFSVQTKLLQTLTSDLSRQTDAHVGPILQTILVKLWERASLGDQMRVLTFQDYRKIEQSGLSLRDFLNEAIENKSASNAFHEAAKSGLILDILYYHTKDNRFSHERTEAELASVYTHCIDEVRTLIRQLEDGPGNLLARSTNCESETTTRLVHDTLAPFVAEAYFKSISASQKARRILDRRRLEWANGQMGTPLDRRELSIVEKGLPATRALSQDEEFGELPLLLHSREFRKRRQLLNGVLIAAGVAALGAIVGLAGFLRHANENLKSTIGELETTNRKLRNSEFSRRIEFSNAALHEGDLEAGVFWLWKARSIASNDEQKRVLDLHLFAAWEAIGVKVPCWGQFGNCEIKNHQHGLIIASGSANDNNIGLQLVTHSPYTSKNLVEPIVAQQFFHEFRFSNTGNKLITCGYSSAVVWDLSKASRQVGPVMNFQPQNGLSEFRGVNLIPMLSQDENYAAIAIGKYDECNVWNLNGSEEQDTRVKIDFNLRGAAILRDAIVLCGPSKLHVFNLESKTQNCDPIEINDPVFKAEETDNLPDYIMCSSDTSNVVFVGKETIGRLFQFGSKFESRLTPLRTRTSFPIVEAAFSPNGEILVTVESNVNAAFERHWENVEKRFRHVKCYVRAWDAKTGKQRSSRILIKRSAVRAIEFKDNNSIWILGTFGLYDIDLNKRPNEVMSPDQSRRLRNVQAPDLSLALANVFEASGISIPKITPPETKLSQRLLEQRTGLSLDSEIPTALDHKDWLERFGSKSTN